MLDIKDMRFTTAHDPEVATHRGPLSYLGLPGPQFLQIFRTSFALNCRMTQGEAKELASEHLKRHVWTINWYLDHGEGGVFYDPPVEDDEQVVGEGSCPSIRRPHRIMHGCGSFYKLGRLPGRPGIMAMKGRELILVTPFAWETCEGYMSEYAREAYWLSELALGFSDDQRCYYRTFEGHRIDAMANWDLSEFNG